MAGNQNSGRRGYEMELKAKKAIDLSFSTIIKALEDESLDIDLRLKCAIPLATKYFPEKLEIDNVNQLTGDQKFLLLSTFLERFKTIPIIDATDK